MSLVVPAVLPTSRIDLEEKLALFASWPAVSRVQIDVVDGKFASPASWPYIAQEELRDMVGRGQMLPELHRIEYEIDLMCLDAEQAVGAWLALGATRLTFHAESVLSLSKFFSSVGQRYGADFVMFGLALNVASDLSLIEPYLSQIGYIQFMGITTIGRQGQPFNPSVLEKVRVFRTEHPEIPVQVDGGVSLESAKKLIALGVGNLIVGSRLVRATDPVVEIAKFEALRSSSSVY